MLRLDPMIKLSIIVAFGVAVTMLMGVGKPNAQDKLAIINKTQLNRVAAPHVFQANGHFDLQRLPEVKTKL